jgi:tetratricopeptide (TPR) repeat protein
MGRSRHAWTFVLLILAFVPAGAGDTPIEVEARKLLEAGEAEGAVSLIEERSPESERSPDVWFVLAQAYHGLLDEAGLLKKKGYANKMKGALETALEIDPGHVDARRELADFYHYAPWIVGGSETEAEKQLELLEKVAPGEASVTRGRHARDEGDLETARDHYRKAVDAGPRAPEVLLVLAVIEQQLDNYPESFELLEEVIDADPTGEKAYYYCARATAMAGINIERGLECAEHYLETCKECDDSDRGYGWWRRATLYKRKGETDAAISAYREALRLNPELDGARQSLEELER